MITIRTRGATEGGGLGTRTPPAFYTLAKEMLLKRGAVNRINQVGSEANETLRWEGQNG